MKASDLKELTKEQLEEKILLLKQESFNLRFQSASHQLKNPSRIREVKREIARSLTILKEKGEKIKK